MDLAIIPECFVDTNLIETLVPPKKGYNHQKGCGTVAKVMREVFGDSFAVGIIDRDKHQLDYLNEFDIVADREVLFLLKHKTKHHYIVQVSPAMEVFLITQAAANGVSMEDHQLPTDLEKLKKVTKTANSKDDTRFKGLIRAIRRAGSAEFQTIASWIGYLKEYNYNANLDALKEM